MNNTTDDKTDVNIKTDDTGQMLFLKEPNINIFTNLSQDLIQNL